MTSSHTDKNWRKKPVVVHAVQWFKMGDHPAVCMVKDYLANGGRGEESPGIDTLEGKLRVSPGDWIITGVKGECYACKPDIFAATYEPASTVSATGATDENIALLRQAEDFIYECTGTQFLSGPAGKNATADRKWIRTKLLAAARNVLCVRDELEHAPRSHAQRIQDNTVGEQEGDDHPGTIAPLKPNEPSAPQAPCTPAPYSSNATEDGTSV